MNRVTPGGYKDKPKVSAMCKQGKHYSRCMAKDCACECHKTGR